MPKKVSSTRRQTRAGAKVQKHANKPATQPGKRNAGSRFSHRQVKYAATGRAARRMAIRSTPSTRFLSGKRNRTTCVIKKMVNWNWDIDEPATATKALISGRRSVLLEGESGDGSPPPPGCDHTASRNAALHDMDDMNAGRSSGEYWCQCQSQGVAGH